MNKISSNAVHATDTKRYSIVPIYVYCKKKKPNVHSAQAVKYAPLSRDGSACLPATYLRYDLRVLLLIHDVFHASLLADVLEPEPRLKNLSHQPTGENVWEIERTQSTASRMKKRRKKMTTEKSDPHKIVPVYSIIGME